MLYIINALSLIPYRLELRRQTQPQRGRPSKSVLQKRAAAAAAAAAATSISTPVPISTNMSCSLGNLFPPQPALAPSQPSSPCL
ncbi:unnamed protein product [Protopolystoma xenopodis]|uniref:Uncharacterized protein n=1 Tax=Protopolystoma xenopodis TaxID=117903 RepID=A0A448XKK1_9PLAT|nr:unnamed protein product [Protopolystoma xenopodis]